MATKRPLPRQARIWSLALLAFHVFSSKPSVASPQVVNAFMNGARGAPLRTTSGVGSCSAAIDATTGSVSFSGTFSGLSAPAHAATVHGLAGPGVVAPVILNHTSITPALAGTFSGSGVLAGPLVGGMLNGQTYCEIADSAFPSGEIRGQLTAPASVPALPPGAIVFLAVAFGGGFLSLRNRARRPESS